MLSNRKVMSRLVFGAILLGCGAALFLFLKSRPSPAEDAFERGSTLAGAGMVADARIAFQESIQKDAHFAPPHRALAQLDVRDKKYQDAIAHWKDYLALQKEPKHAQCQLAYSELMSGLEVPALHDAEEELKHNPTCAQSHLIAGVLYARKGTPKLALDHLAFAYKAYPDIAHVKLNYGRVLTLTGSFDQAEQVLLDILTKDKGHAEPYYLLGYVYARRPASPENRRRHEGKG